MNKGARELGEVRIDNKILLEPERNNIDVQVMKRKHLLYGQSISSMQRPRSSNLRASAVTLRAWYCTLYSLVFVFHSHTGEYASSSEGPMTLQRWLVRQSVKSSDRRNGSPRLGRVSSQPPIIPTG